MHAEKTAVGSRGEPWVRVSADMVARYQNYGNGFIRVFPVQQARPGGKNAASGEAKPGEEDNGQGISYPPPAKPGL